MSDKNPSPLGDEVRPHAVLQAIWQYLHEAADAAGKSKLVELTEQYGQHVAPEYKAEDKPASKAK